MYSYVRPVRRRGSNFEAVSKSLRGHQHRDDVCVALVSICIAFYKRFQCLSYLMKASSSLIWFSGSCCRRRLAAFFIVGFAAQPSSAEAEMPLETLKGLHPYATVAVAYDSNPLRRSDDGARSLAAVQSIVGGAVAAAIPSELYQPESDVYTTLEAGFATDIGLSRQHLLLSARIYRVLYDRLNEYDNTGGNAEIRWKWVAGSLWEGDLGYQFLRKQRDFANQSVPTNDMLDRNTVYATLSRWLTPRWRLGSLLNVAATSFDDSDFGSEGLDQTLYRLGADLDYVTKAGSVFGLAATYSEGKYWDRDTRNYAQATLGPGAEWMPTAKLKIKGHIAYKAFRHEESSEQDRDFEGLVGRIKANWQITKKTSIAGIVSRDFSNLNDESSNFAVVDTVSIEPFWQVTTKTSMRVMASFQRQDYQSFQSSADPGLNAPVDELTAFGLWLDWRPLTNVVASIGYTAGARESTRELKDYDFQNVQLSFSFGL